ncbi:MAG: multidrug efflux SMR transporter [Rhodobacteraceae bacterium]|nr:multidrug efflux SMR transporter [Paracoccaceae bacterium]
MPKHLLFLLLAILSEVIATTALAASQQFTRLGPSVLVVLGYGLSFYLLSVTLKVMPVGIVYAIWSGLGVVGIAVLGYLLFNQTLDAAAVLGMTLIIAGVLVINLFSASAGH